MDLRPQAKIIDYSTFSTNPEWFTTAPATAIEELLKRNTLNQDDVDLYEINEAFAVSSIAVNRILGLNHNKVNIAGGAVALGHPIGASGARILTTLIHNLHRTRKKIGIAALCIGGGEAVAVLVEALLN
jgi:acetyl-CoA C-acetyltransferase